jgi:hypothetical protein
LGELANLEEQGDAYRVLVGKAEGKRPLRKMILRKFGPRLD